MSAKKYYQERANYFEEKVAVFKKKSTRYALFRLLSFLSILISIYALYNFLWMSVLIAVILFFVFLFFVRKSVDIKQQLQFFSALLAINKNELAVLSGDFSRFSDGEAYKNTQHPYSYDLDVFGNKSIYQFLNRTISKKGADLLASYLENGVNHQQEYHKTTEALCNAIDWTQDYRAVGSINTDEKEEKALENWLKAPLEYSGVLSVLRFVLPICAVLGTVALSLNMISETQFLIVVAACLFPIALNLKKSNKVASHVAGLKNRLVALNSQINLVKNLAVSSPQIEQLKLNLFQDEDNAASAFSTLIKQIERFDMRNNIVVSILLNLFLAYDFQLIIGLANWKKKYGTSLIQYESNLVEFEVLICMSNFKFNAPENCYPVLTDAKQTTVIEIEEMGHPLLLHKSMIRNSYQLQDNQAFSIITGPNMAGKSTFLRSVGVNLMLAKAGFSVVAKNFQFPDLKLYSSMRTADNLNEESSYFYAELIRLRFIADAMDRGESVFIILDEILKGTNSKDKEEGSAKFLNKLVRLGAKGIIATHDLSLTVLAQKNEKLVNKYFDSTISGEDISFSYTIKDGVVKNMNASFLLKQMELID